MKVIRKEPSGETRELLLKEYFLNAYLIALLKRVGDETGRIALRRQPELEPAPARSRR